MDYWCAITQNSSYGTLSLKNTVLRNHQKIAGTFEFSCAKGKNSNYWSFIFDTKIRIFFNYLKWHNLHFYIRTLIFHTKQFLHFWNIWRFFGVVANCKRGNIHFWCQETKAWKMMGFSFNCGGWGGCIFIDVFYYYIGEKNKAFIT